MSETQNQNQNTANSAQQTDRTFTQAELDAIVQNRVREQTAKYADYEDLKAKAAKYDEAENANKSELQKATDKANALQAKLNQYESEKKIREIREKVSKETGVPADLLAGNDEESCKAMAKAIKDYTKQSTGYPLVKDGGEQNHSGGGSAKQQFMDWFQNH